MLFSSPEKGRSVSLLPETSIVILRKSDILPRVAQLAERLHKNGTRWDQNAFMYQFNGGASSTADIELKSKYGEFMALFMPLILLLKIVSLNETIQKR